MRQFCRVIKTFPSAYTELWTNPGINSEQFLLYHGNFLIGRNKIGRFPDRFRAFTERKGVLKVCIQDIKVTFWLSVKEDNKTRGEMLTSLPITFPKCTYSKS